MRRITAGVAVLLLAAACSGGGDDSATTTTAAVTTLPPSPTTTSLPPRSATEVDVCGLVNPDDLEPVLEDAGEGEGTDTTPHTSDVPPLLTAECAWPSADDPQLVLHYLAPTTADSGEQHLADVLAQDPGFVHGGTVLSPVDVNHQSVGYLVDDEAKLREVAVVKRSALLYLVVDQDVDGRDPDALMPYGELIVSALIRAPR